MDIVDQLQAAYADAASKQGAELAWLIVGAVAPARGTPTGAVHRAVRTIVTSARPARRGSAASGADRIRCVRGHAGGPSTVTLHDIVADPLQATNLVTDRVSEAAALYDALLALRTGPGAPPAGTLTAEQVAKLLASGTLGY